MEHGTNFLRDIAMVLCVAAVTTVLFRKLRQPVVVGYLLAGVLVGPHVPFPLFADSQSVHTLSELGVILVMFSIGLEFSFRRLLSVLPTAGLIALIQVSAMLWLGYLAGQLLGWGQLASVYAGASLCIASTMIVARLMDEQHAPAVLRELVFGVLVVEDLAAVLLLALFTAFGRQAADASLADVLATVAHVLVVLVALVAGGYLVLPRAIRAVARLASAETLLVSSVGSAFALALLAESLGLSVALGAFLAGNLIAEARRGEQVEHLVRPVRDMFAAIFFVAVGMTVEPAALLTYWPAVLLFLAVVVVGKVGSVLIGGVLSGHSVRTSIQTGLSLTSLGEFSFLFVALGAQQGAMEPSLVPVVISVATLTAFLGPLFMRLSEPVALAVERRLPHAVQTFVTLYDTWLARLRARRRTGRSPARRLVLVLALDGLLLAGLVAGTSLTHEPLRLLVHERLGWDETPARWLVAVAVLVVALPLVLGLVAASRRLGALLAEQALPPAPAGRADFGAAPRRALLVGLQLGVLLAVLVPALALTQPFVPVLSGAPILILLVAIVGVSFWRSATDLQAHVRAGAEVILEALRQAGPADDKREVAALTAPQVEQLLPGLGSVAEVHVAAGMRADGATLRQLDLRGRTGATVVAVQRGEDCLASPGGATRLQTGDILAVAGTREALSAATELLRSPPQPE